MDKKEQIAEKQFKKSEMGSMDEEEKVRMHCGKPMRKAEILIDDTDINGGTEVVFMCQVCGDF
jgi:hypothetical protein